MLERTRISKIYNRKKKEKNKSIKSEVQIVTFRNSFKLPFLIMHLKENE